MIIKQENAVLLCVKSKDWEIKKENKTGTSYSALVYAEKDVATCKTSKEVYELFKDDELLTGTAMIEIIKTSYNDKEKISYVLVKFGKE